MFVKTVFVLLLVVQLLGMIWAWRTATEQEQRGLWRLVLTVLWPLTWLIAKIGVVQ